MASPMVDGRVEPHRKATYTLELGDQLRGEGRSAGGLSGVKCMHELDPLPLSPTYAYAYA